MKFDVPYCLIEQEDDVYVSICPVTSVSSYGDTEEEALRNHNEAMELFFEDMPEAWEQVREGLRRIKEFFENASEDKKDIAEDIDDALCDACLCLAVSLNDKPEFSPLDGRA